jgi:hypothetical protein
MCPQNFQKYEQKILTSVHIGTAALNPANLTEFFVFFLSRFGLTLGY